MTASRPEAEAKYSRGRIALRGALARRNGRSDRTRARSRRAARAVALVAAAMLAVAEFLPLYQVRTDTGDRTISTVSAGSHHAYAQRSASRYSATCPTCTAPACWARPPPVCAAPTR